jgi:hypothetical protein
MASFRDVFAPERRCERDILGGSRITVVYARLLNAAWNRLVPS